MKLKCLGSSSKGNSYLLIGKTRVLLLEAGLPVAEVKRALGFTINNIDGCLITHEHGDHCGRVRDYLSSGIDCYASAGTIKASGAARHNFHILEKRRKYKIGEFEVMPFQVIHDAKEPFGYLINHPECGLIMFMTDSSIIPFTFTGLRHIMIEANFSQEILDRQTEADIVHPGQRARIMHSHMSIENCVEALKANDLKTVQNIILLHLSDGNSNAAEFCSLIQREVGKVVTIADKGVEMNLSIGGF